MNPQSIDWMELLRRMESNSHRLGELERSVATGAMLFPGFFVELLASGFTIPEAQELYSLLRA
jgi:hypothetical protein